MQSSTNKDKNKNKIIILLRKKLLYFKKKNYFIYFTNSVYKTPNTKCSTFFITSFKIT